VEEWLVAWKTEELCFSARSWFENLLTSLDEAKHSVELETFIFDNDPIGARVLDALQRASARGVRVRLLVDGLGASAWLSHWGHRVWNLNIEVRIFHPLPTRVLSLCAGVWLPFVKSLEMLVRLNNRTHCKILVVDGCVAWVGSWNISKTHYGARSGFEWRDAGVVLTGGSVAALVALFERTWESSFYSRHGGIKRTFKKIRQVLRWEQEFVGNYIHATFASRARKRFRREFCARIEGAKQNVWLATAYFVPPPKLARALVRSAKQGADVRILVPAHSDVPVVSWVSRVYYAALVKSGVRIFEFTPAMMHAKYCVADNWVFLGSANMNFRSLYRDSELGVVLAKKESRDALMTRFLEDLECAREMRASSIRFVPWWQRILGLLFLRVRFWL
jgi:cardiolipin synthase